MISRHLLAHKLQEIPNFTAALQAKRTILSSLLWPQIDYVTQTQTQILKEHEKLCGPCSEILFNNRAYESALFGETMELHPSLHIRMEQWQTMSNNTSMLITLMDNFMTAVLLKAKNEADLKALLPLSMHNDYWDAIAAFKPIMIAKCWKTSPTLSEAAIERFKTVQEGPLHAIKILQLNQLTI